MKIIYSPEYSGKVFVKPAEGGKVMMDSIVVNTIGLVNLLELRLGLHYEEKPANERLALYYDAMSRYMKQTEHNILTDSFNNAELSTAKAVLAWRDELKMAGWNFQGEEISDRLKVIIGIEEYLKEDGGYDFSDRLRVVTDLLSTEQLDCKDMEIELPCSLKLLRPIEQELIKALECQGAAISLLAKAANGSNNLSAIRRLISEGKKQDEIVLSEKDDSFLIYTFPDERTAHEYLTFTNMEDVDVWVNEDNKPMDDWLALMGKPKAGSVMQDCTPQLTQLFIMGIGLYGTPLNVNTLIEWLNMPIHPLSRTFRMRLADTIVSEGGYRNEKCEAVIRHFVDGEYDYLTEEQSKLSETEQKKIREKDRQKRADQVKAYLPSLEPNNLVFVEQLRRFVSVLSSWARQRAHLMAEEGEELLWAEQLLATASMADAFHILLGTITTDTIDYKIIDSWVSTIYTKAAYTNVAAEVGSRTVVDGPSKIISNADRIVWMGFEGGHGQTLECAFLYPTEREKLIEKKYIQAWDNEKEVSFHEQMLLNPLYSARKQLVLVVYERRNGEVTEKHPLVVRLKKQVKNLDTIISTPKIAKKHFEEVEVVENGGVVAELEFDHADKLKWPGHLSATAISSLVEYPFDFLMEYLLKVDEDAKAKMSNVHTTKGNVAHRVIEILFAPRNGKRYAEHTEIRTRISDEYENVYQQVLEAKGAILQLPENRLNEKLLHEQLRICLDTLLEILKDNNLKVVANEEFVEDFVGFELPEEKDKKGNVKKRDLIGFIDMTLEDEQGKPVIFDFKWTSSRSYYQGLLEKNRSIQLEIYRYLLMRKTKNNVERVAYFLMPEARLYSKELFKGIHCTQIAPENEDQIVEELKNSIMFRKRQLDRGIVETNGAYDTLSYVQETQNQNLYPLEKEEKGTKKDNRFSKYGILNN